MPGLTVTIPYSVRIPRELLDEMRRLYDRMEPPKPTFSAILSHIVRLGWDSYKTQKNSDMDLQKVTVTAYPKRIRDQAFQR
jgi:hypothetical protein